MSHSKYLIIGGGMTAAAAVRGIREVDPNGSIGLLSAELDPPYNRPPLSKGLWKGEPPDSIWIDIDGRDVAYHLGCMANLLDPHAKRVVDTQGTTRTFDKLLLATGGTPRRLPFGDDQDDAIVYFRTLDDYRRLRTLADQRQRFAVIGGGFIGAEIAAALRMNGNDVVMIFPAEDIGGRLFPPDLARFLSGIYREKVVEVLAGDAVIGLDARGDHRVLRTRSGREVVVDGVVAGIGIQPNVALAQEAGLAVNDGVLVDEFLRASHADIYAAGDVAAFDDPTLGVRRRVEHEDNANVMGRLAGRAMAGDAQSYRHLPFFYSDLFELGYEAVGDLDTRLEMVTDWTEPYREGVVYYVQNSRVRGVLLWNVWGQVEAARRLIAEPGPFRPSDLIGRLPTAD